MVVKRYSLSHERMKFLTLSIDTSLLPSKWRLLNVLEFPSTRFPPIKTQFKRIPILGMHCERWLKEIKRYYF